MRKLFHCDDCGCTVASERDLDEKEDGTKICPNCGSTSIDVYGFLYELESYNPNAKYISIEIPGFEKTGDVMSSYKKMTEGWKK